MRHGDKINNLGRTHAHREAMLANMASSLILHKRIETTIAKAKVLRKFIEPLITKSKDDSTNSRRVVFSYLKDKEATKEMFATVSEAVANRPGGYTRIIKTGFRLGDAADMCFIELVDFNELLKSQTEAKKAKTGRTRRGKKTDVKPAEVKFDKTDKAEPVKAQAVEKVIEKPDQNVLTEE